MLVASTTISLQEKPLIATISNSICLLQYSYSYFLNAWQSFWGEHFISQTCSSIQLYIVKTIHTTRFLWNPHRHIISRQCQSTGHQTPPCLVSPWTLHSMQHQSLKSQFSGMGTVCKHNGFPQAPRFNISKQWDQHM